MSGEEFVAAFGDVAEHSPWVAEDAARTRPFVDREDVIGKFTAALQGASLNDQLSVLRAHPDLAGKAAIAGELTEDSRNEQAGAGLDKLTGEEFGRFTTLNDAYKARFDIPFIFAVKGADKASILKSFGERVGNDVETELANALDNVCRILRFRIEDRVAR
ncbi:MAG: 2-oxo-4-hydroxy-4-carboxy-5-ureidoimidazoline decarboxylase [Rhodospirillaceae bacterium]|mgnify:FL=1|nr:2-oxo-4-hydroxy-4-carboxy-5-ureidoimidazoline decarboxylase [Rhodospirillaceae bacterium]MBT4490516.1 2-oxo-4-hydroxy-4-carboxy-5-ureidoimidazoline decarboxylase [Rhodospirillaceae bacterium]MBT5194210.1 2-oxo-4-hydroxy-4-carboxy-5-ureidoimidazoline decarboxylase [Rhodospirillaceae bacterium]MBT5894269.1 2-oxo-4-hydroxy-4-carboxy-5-ureidoimidazoline decarboxylase [Rhodospirillaceae bacterium]MBT6427063.1 2-oxo-4-hydroxy-4-carboxy-5-ureidoimidazoline decarboxylase [Rhodospirillaceae bacterium